MANRGCGSLGLGDQPGEPAASASWAGQPRKAAQLGSAEHYALIVFVGATGEDASHDPIPRTCSCAESLRRGVALGWRYLMNDLQTTVPVKSWMRPYGCPRACRSDRRRGRRSSPHRRQTRPGQPYLQTAAVANVTSQGTSSLRTAITEVLPEFGLQNSPSPVLDPTRCSSWPSDTNGHGRHQAVLAGGAGLWRRAGLTTASRPAWSTPRGRGTSIWFQQLTSRGRQANRIHFDVRWRTTRRHRGSRRPSRSGTLLSAASPLVLILATPMA